MADSFNQFACKTAAVVGHPFSFLIALLILIIWLASGPFLKFSDTWQLVINTATTVITFLIVFVIQNTQNRDAKAIHLKLDELIRALQSARNNFVDLENLPEEEIRRIEAEFKKFRGKVEREEVKKDLEQESPDGAAKD